MANTGSSFGGSPGFEGDKLEVRVPDDAPTGDSFVPLAPRRAPTQMTGPSEAVNLVEVLEDVEKGAYLKKMSATCLDDYDADVQSRQARMKKIKRFQELYASIIKKKSFPFQNAATVNLPFLTYPLLQIHARLYDMVCPANGKVMYCSPTNSDDVSRAADCEKFGNSYIRYRMDNYATGMDSSLMQMGLNGSMFRRTYWSEYDGKTCCDAIPMEDFVVSYWQQSNDPSMRDVPRYTMVQRLTIYDLEDYAAQGIYASVEGIEADDGEERTDKDDGFRDTVNKEDGVEPSHDSSVEDKPRMVLEQHRRWRMPNKPALHPSFDGRAHAVIITIDERSRRVLRVVVREEDDPADLARFEQESATFAQYQAELDAHAMMLAAPPPVDEVTGMPMPVEQPPVPTPPRGVKVDKDGAPVPPKPIRQREIAFFTHYKCFPGEGFYGHGFGDFLAPLAEAANTILNQHIDGVTLRNARPGFISRQLRGPRGAQSVQPGELQEVDAPMGAIKDGIAWLDPPQADPSTIGILELLQEMVEKFGGGDIMSGEPSKSNQTARGTIVLSENAMAQISVLARRVKEAQKHELDKIWRTWGVFLPESEVASIIDENGVFGEVKIGRDMFRPDAHVMPASDPRMKFQKVEETQFLWSMAQQNPLMMQSPGAIKAITEDMLRAMNAEKIIPLIQPPPPQPPPPPVPHWQEDAGFLRGQDHQVHQQDDDAAHIEGHASFMQSPAGGMLEKTQRQMLENHVRHHAAQRLEKAGNDLQRILSAPDGPIAGGAGGVAGAPGNGGAPAMA